MIEDWQSVIISEQSRYYRLAYSYVKNRDDALDIVQEALYKSLKNYRRMRDPEAVKTWFFRIVVNTALNYLKKNKRAVYLDDEQWETIPDKAESHDLSLKDAVASLPPKEKTVILLRYFEDLKISEIANILQENENTVKSRLYAALKKLKVNSLHDEEV